MLKHGIVSTYEVLSECGPVGLKPSDGHFYGEPADRDYKPKPLSDPDPKAKSAESRSEQPAPRPPLNRKKSFLKRVLKSPKEAVAKTKAGLKKTDPVSRVGVWVCVDTYYTYAGTKMLIKTDMWTEQL